MKKLLLVGLVLSFFFAVKAQEINGELAATTSLIQFSNGNFGSGILITDSQYVFLVTARHVIYKPPNSFFLVGDTAVVSSFGKMVTSESSHLMTINLKMAGANDCIAGDRINDAVVILIGVVEKNLTGYSKAVTIFKSGTAAMSSTSNISRFESVRLAQEVYVFGYPNTIGFGNNQFEKDKPLLSKGIVAEKNESSKRIIINAQVYHGNSGGPVWAIYPEFGSAHLIGLVTDLVPYESEIYKVDTLTKKPRQDSSQFVYNNSNYSVITPMDNVLALMRRVEATWPSYRLNALKKN